MIRNVPKSLGYARLALVAGVAIPVLISSSALAQQPAASPGTQIVGNAPGPALAPAPAAAGEATTDRVVVTGSYIPTAEEVTASPLDTLTSAEVQRSGSSDVLTVLQNRNPDFVGGGNLGSTNANISSGNTLGGSIVQIRGFPTLVLSEGRRVADAAALAVGGAQFSDLGLFPAALLSRIEVLKDGASALYGSEAVGGVINVFTKNEFQGAEIGFRYGTTVEGAVAERRGYAIAGAGNEHTQVMVGMQYLEMDALFQRQREYSAVTVGGTSTFGGDVRGATASSPGLGFFIARGFNLTDYPGAVIANSPFDLGVVPGSVARATGFNDPQLLRFYQPAEFGTGSSIDVLQYNLAKVPTSTLDTARTNVVASASHQIFGKQLEIFGNFLFSNSDYENFLNAQPLNNATGVIIPAGRNGLLPGQPGYIAGVNNTIFNPFNVTINAGTLTGARIQVNNRYQIAPRIFSFTNNFYRFLAGMRSQINEDWMVETAAYYSKYDISYLNRNLVIANQLNAMIAGTAPGIGPLDFFAINPVGTGPGQVTGEQFATIFGSNVRNLSSFQRVFDAKVVGFPFSLPGGKVGLSVGGEYRLEGFKVNGSPEIFVGSVPIQNVNKKRDIKSVFAELSIPIVGSSMHVPGIYHLELGLAGRFDRYEGISEDAKVPKVTLRYQPIKDLTLRATYSNSFIAPNLYQTVGPAGQGFSQGITFDGVQQGQAQVRSGSNPDLVPSNAETYTAGLVYSPSYIPGLVLTADYFRILQQNIVGTLGGNLILQSVHALGAASPYADLVRFGAFPPGGTPVVNPHDLDGNLSTVFYLDVNQNLGAQRTEGFDLSLRYNMDLHAAGQLELGINSVVFTKYDAKTLPFGSPYYNLLGLNGTEFFGVIPDYKLTFLAEYRIWGFTLSLIANYIPETLSAVGRDPETEDQSTFDAVDDFFMVNGRLSYTFKGRTHAGAAAVDHKDSKHMVDHKGGAMHTSAAGAEMMSPMQKLIDGLTLTVGCNNMFDQQPPFIDGGNSNTNLSVYDPYGQFVYFEVSKKF